MIRWQQPCRLTSMPHAWGLGHGDVQVVCVCGYAYDERSSPSRVHGVRGEISTCRGAALTVRGKSAASCMPQRPYLIFPGCCGLLIFNSEPASPSLPLADVTPNIHIAPFTPSVHHAHHFLPSFFPSLCRDQLEAVVKSIQDTVKVQETELAEFTVCWEAHTIRREGGGGHGACMHRWRRGIDSVWSTNARVHPSHDLPSLRPISGHRPSIRSE